MVEAERVHALNEKQTDEHAPFVLYWMQQAQRADFNHALEFALAEAERLEKPLLCIFCLDPHYPEANARHFAFMLQGLAETVGALADRGIKTLARIASPPDAVVEVAGKAALVVCDHGYLRHQTSWRRQVAEACSQRVVGVESDVLVPVESASGKREWAARTIRKKLEEKRAAFTRSVKSARPSKSSLPLRQKSELDLRDWERALEMLDVDASVPRVKRFVGGAFAARRRLTSFLRTHLPGYASERKDPSRSQTSELSPYLHFGQISPVEIALKVERARSPSKDDKNAFLEELIVRRELACNFVHFTEDYDKFSALPDWARQTLREHEGDERPARYSRARLEAAETHDEYWNAAMRELTATGYMHNYMRMYWGKKILEWSNTPKYAFDTALHLNNKYFLDGRDPNSFANVAWVFGLHDRPWAEREVFGKVRYMSAGGLEAKFDMDGYLRRVEGLVSAEKED